ncbi:MAG: transcription antitermination factor NusB [Lachnospiraceae bacterium]|nr:transcription antitermination factor NusB [Lachnospiraceae bacterium]MDY4126314.1 transcription antitermination factor NusB [Lachnospiraceae bacterium]
MSRHKLREQVFKLLFRIEFNDSVEMEEQKELFFTTSDVETTEEESRYIEEKYQAVVDKLDKIDELISSNAKGWSIDRMSKVDLTILRLGVYEMIFDDTIPEDVALNEAIELAKEFGQDQSYSFINGVLAKLHK